jgi:hypothetical protein
MGDVGVGSGGLPNDEWIDFGEDLEVFPPGGNGPAIAVVTVGVAVAVIGVVPMAVIGVVPMAVIGVVPMAVIGVVPMAVIGAFAVAMIGALFRTLVMAVIPALLGASAEQAKQ